MDQAPYYLDRIRRDAVLEAIQRLRVSRAPVKGGPQTLTVAPLNRVARAPPVGTPDKINVPFF
jgi:hypothetical protein